jgi:hypothetical protein
MEQDLHSQKITILSRLIKESSLTLEECLLLLKEEEVENQTVITTRPSFQPISTPFWGRGTTTTGTFPSFIGTSITTEGTIGTLTTSNTPILAMFF